MKIDIHRRPGKTYLTKKMTEKQEETCENCGKTEEFCRLNNSCKKFKSKNHSPQTSSAGGSSVSPGVRSRTTNQASPEDTPSENSNSLKSSISTPVAEGTFNLSEMGVLCKCEKCLEFGKSITNYSQKNVKKAIRKLKEEMFALFGHEAGGTMGEIDGMIDKIFGKKLI